MDDTSSASERAVYFRGVAVHLRGIANELRLEPRRQSQLLALADGFERYAQRFEQLAERQEG